MKNEGSSVNNPKSYQLSFVHGRYCANARWKAVTGDEVRMPVDPNWPDYDLLRKITHDLRGRRQPSYGKLIDILDKYLFLCIVETAARIRPIGLNRPSLAFKALGQVVRSSCQFLAVAMKL